MVLAYIITIATWFASLPFATLVVPAFHPLFIFVLYGAMGLLYVWKMYLQGGNTLSGWEIVEESEHKVQQETQQSNKAGLDQGSTPAETPIFFR